MVAWYRGGIVEVPDPPSDMTWEDVLRAVRHGETTVAHAVWLQARRVPLSEGSDRQRVIRASEVLMAYPDLLKHIRPDVRAAIVESLQEVGE